MAEFYDIEHAAYIILAATFDGCVDLEVTYCAEVMIKIRRFEQGADLAPCRLVIDTAKPGEATAIGLQHIEQDTQQGGLTAAIGPQHAKHTAFRHIERDTF